MNKGYLWVLGSALLVTVAQLSLKMGVVELPSFSLGWHWLQLEWLTDNVLSLGIIFIGLVCYALSMLCWLFALKYIPLNKAYPLISLSYVFVYVLAVLLPWFNEPATWIKAAGIAFILFGVWMISRPTKPLTKKAK
ncbi:Undecaprenyl phosphate-aminoarabinose flippase subunit ArnF [Providencia rustigianii]|uniref:Probable 4-amino-4-deoxy-L-arabinose-phosphoundecaprenol flippase subunit ArnF n=2 Tax=Providencia rustigianii TaxID=158850 RepID=D1NY78_9GAMM|nr:MULTISPECIES: 4-amino-4-deoxy-L-arabinose-phosphoundecaprenol flippase subunit ArnF [Providencia]EFB73926.1 multidrug resistance protein, SMR family [Providencia rustigianii DSM 4541]MTC57222.1 4-amino-4-deoxy-L-arabinose-phosphoundecaprenol flippase subunit ArnF [Providencia rustigianii]MTC60794.1 4-amino-4-deoxy-L-arabinose-phosphoundecaprenol flippase subunit ArnF [Providencia rustigianii]SPY77338.1 Undecaprenyl phosphate-aminoarabinose flippase subunit ArnF [Providencia rustigianii]SUC2